MQDREAATDLPRTTQRSEPTDGSGTSMAASSGRTPAQPSTFRVDLADKPELDVQPAPPPGQPGCSLDAIRFAIDGHFHDPGQRVGHARRENAAPESERVMVIVELDHLALFSGSKQILLVSAVFVVRTKPDQRSMRQPLPSLPIGPRLPSNRVVIAAPVTERHMPNHFSATAPNKTPLRSG